MTNRAKAKGDRATVSARLKASRHQRLRWIGWMIDLRRWLPYRTWAE